MQSSETRIESLGPTTTVSWLERLTWREKLPVAFVSGCLLAGSTPGFDIWWLAWVSIAPFLVLLRGAGSKLAAVITGFAFGLGFYAAALSWYFGLYPLRWLGVQDWLAIQAVTLVWLFESIHQSLLLAAFAWLVYALPMRSSFIPHFRRPFFPYLLGVPLIWVFFHWVVATSDLFLGMPVCQLAYTQHSFLPFIQMARLGGSGLLDFLIVLCNAALAAAMIELTNLAPRFESRMDQISPRVGGLVDIAAISIVILLAVSWGSGELKSICRTTCDANESHFYLQTPPVPVAVVQGNVTIEEDRLKTASATEIAQRYNQLMVDQGVDFLFLPEGAVTPDQMGAGLLLSRLKGIVAAQKKEAITGTTEVLDKGEVNCVRLIAKPMPKESIYIKRRATPFGEFAPLGPLGHLTQQIKMPGEESDDAAEARSRLLRSMWGKVGVSISTELIYPRLIADEVRRGASLIVNVSNLSRFHNSSLNKQVLAAATLRAVENGRFVVVAANTGISAVIDPSGVVTSRSLAGKRGVLVDTVQFLYKHTPFSKMWWL